MYNSPDSCTCNTVVIAFNDPGNSTWATQRKLEEGSVDLEQPTLQNNVYDTSCCLIEFYET